MNLAETLLPGLDVKAPWQMTLTELGQAHQASAFHGDNRPAGWAFRAPSWTPETQTP